MPLAHFAVAVKGAAWTDPDSIALMVMQTMLGGWDKYASAGKHMGYSINLFCQIDLLSSVMIVVDEYWPGSSAWRIVSSFDRG